MDRKWSIIVAVSAIIFILLPVSCTMLLDKLARSSDEINIKEKELWVAKEKIPVYADLYTGNDIVIFELEAGDVCTPILMNVDKVGIRFYDVLCTKGHGKVMSSYPFEEIRVKNNEPEGK